MSTPIPGPKAHRSHPMLGAVALAVVLAVVAAACGSSNHSSASTGGTDAAPTKAVAGGSLVVGVPVETTGWNPTSNTWDDTGNLIGSTMFEPLATAGSDSGAKPWLATSWIANEEFTRWVIKLRQGVTFQDGAPFNADAVVANFNAYLASPFYTLTITPMFKGVKAVDASTVEVDLAQPWAAFPSSFLDSASAYMMAPSMIAAGADSSKHPVGTGPFSFTSWEPNHELKVTRNAHYWGGLDPQGKVRTGSPYLDSIEFRVITDESSRAAALQAGDIDMETTIDPHEANTLASSFNETKDWDAGSVFVQLNAMPTVDGKPNPFANPHARQAVAYATDAAAVTKQAGDGLKIATSPFGPSTPWGLPTDQNGWVSPDLSKAKAEVAAYQKDTGNSALNVTLMGLPDVTVTHTLQLLAAQWKKAGINTQIQSLDQSTRITHVVTGDYQATYTNNYGYPDPDNQYYFWTSESVHGPGEISINFSHYADPKIDADLTTGRQSGFPNIRKDAYHDLAKQLNASFTHIWLYYTPFTYISSKKVQGLDTTQGPAHVPFGNFTPKTWWDQVWVTH